MSGESKKIQVCQVDTLDTPGVIDKPKTVEIPNIRGRDSVSYLTDLKEHVNEKKLLG